MPAPIPVELEPHSSTWARLAESEGSRLIQALGANLIAVHHIGSTAIPGMCAKPIIDLIPEVRSLSRLDDARQKVCALGYQWWGEYEISGRRYCTLDDQETGKRRVQLHCFERLDAHIERHMAFRDYLKGHPDIAREYEALKIHARELHPDDSHAYTEAKFPWISALESIALAWYRSRPDSVR